MAQHPPAQQAQLEAGERRNVGRIDRVVRTIIGAGLLVGATIVGPGTFDSLMLAGIGGAILLTALRSQCWLYRFYGVTTSRTPDGILCEPGGRCRLQ